MSYTVESGSRLSKRKKASILIGLSAAALFAAAAAVSAVDTKGLVEMLTSQLGVTKDQAAGGAGSILDYAKGKMKADDFKKVADAVPETNDLLKAAPKVEAGSSMLGGLGGSMGGTGTVGTVAALSGSFQKLGLKSNMIGKFIPIVVNYAQSKGGSTVGTLLSTALGVAGGK
jgi:hypothetical protein